MAQVDYDPSKVKKVSIKKVVPNTWNPKDKKTEDYEKVKESIFQKGLRGTIAVRQHPEFKTKYEIIDGEQRYTAAKELGYEEIYIYDEGEVSDKDARELTIWWQQQVPFNRVDEALLVNELVSAYPIDQIELPYSEKEMKALQELAQFDFNQFTDEEADETLGGAKVFKVAMTPEAFDIVMKAIKHIMKDAECNEGRALELMSADYIASIEELAG